MLTRSSCIASISIHAPSRERPLIVTKPSLKISSISIHAPSRERHYSHKAKAAPASEFQSTLPHGSDLAEPSRLYLPVHFNPRSLTGATNFRRVMIIKITAFQSMLPHGSDRGRQSRSNVGAYFNPRSLTGATLNCV